MVPRKGRWTLNPPSLPRSPAPQGRGLHCTGGTRLAGALPLRGPQRCPEGLWDVGVAVVSFPFTPQSWGPGPCGAHLAPAPAICPRGRAWSPNTPSTRLPQSSWSGPGQWGKWAGGRWEGPGTGRACSAASSSPAGLGPHPEAREEAAEGEEAGAEGSRIQLLPQCHWWPAGGQPWTPSSQGRGPPPPTGAWAGTQWALQRDSVRTTPRVFDRAAARLASGASPPSAGLAAAEGLPSALDPVPSPEGGALAPVPGDGGWGQYAWARWAYAPRVDSPGPGSRPAPLAVGGGAERGVTGEQASHGEPGARRPVRAQGGHVWGVAPLQSLGLVTL